MTQHSVHIRREITVKINQSEMLMEMRRADLVRVDSIERHLGIERTSKMRERYKRLQRENTRLRGLLAAEGILVGGGYEMKEGT